MFIKSFCLIIYFRSFDIADHYKPGEYHFVMKPTNYDPIKLKRRLDMQQPTFLRAANQTDETFFQFIKNT